MRVTLCGSCKRYRPGTAKNGLRSAFAVFETMIGIPLAMLGILAILSVGTIGIVHTQVATDARTKAWGGRHAPWEPSQLYQLQELGLGTPAEYGRILGPRPAMGLDTAIVAQAERVIPLVMPDVFPDQKEAGYWHVVLGGTWDYRQLSFESRREHPRLTPTRKFQYFDRGNEDFGELLLFGGFADGGNLAELVDLAVQVEDAERINQRMEQERRQSRRELNREIDRLMAELAVLEGELHKATEVGLPPGFADALRGAIGELEGNITDLKEAKDLLEKADGQPL